MNDAEYLAFVEATCDAWDDESAARIIEDHCHPPYKRPPCGVLFPPATPAKIYVPATEATP